MNDPNDNAVLFSILLPTFNRESLLPRAITSVLRQSLKQWELIIIDDGSTDSTQSLVRKYTKLDSRIRYLYQENQGAASAKNHGLVHANGKFVAFLDSDDYLKPNHLSSRFEMFKQDPGLDLIYGDAEVIGEKNIASIENSRLIIPLNSQEVRIGGTFTLKTSEMIRMGGFPKVSYGEDIGLFQTAEKAGLNIKKSPYCTYCYDRTQPDSITIKKLKKYSA